MKIANLCLPSLNLHFTIENIIFLHCFSIKLQWYFQKVLVLSKKFIKPMIYPFWSANPNFKNMIPAHLNFIKIEINIRMSLSFFHPGSPIKNILRILYWILQLQFILLCMFLVFFCCWCQPARVTQWNEDSTKTFW